MIEIVDIAEFEEVIKRDDDVLVDLWAPWCGPCRMLSASIDELAEIAPDLVIVKVNVDDSPEISAACCVQSVPTIILFVGGEEVKSRTGFVSARALMSWIKEK
jgi:thioredoxin